jgi:RNA polymerase sigma-70 factor, ECF subfamily
MEWTQGFEMANPLMDSGRMATAAPRAAGLHWPHTVEEFEAFVGEYQHSLVHFAFCRLRNLQDAEDVVQDTLVRLYTDRGDRQDMLRVEPYLYRMVSNRCIDLLRKRKRAELSLEESGAEQACAVSGDDTDAERAAGQLRRIAGLLSKLPSRQAEVIRLRIFGELSFDSIAEAVGSSLPTVKSRFRYGVQKLQRVLRKGGVRP